MGSSRFILCGLATLTDSSRYTCFAWAGGTCPRFAWAGGTFFPVVLLCQFLVLAGNRFWLYILLCTWSTIQLWCCVSFFVVCLVGARSLLRPKKKKIQLSVWRVRDHYYDRKKKIQSSVGRVRDHVCLSCRDRYICISSTWMKPNTNLLVQLQYIRYI